MPRVTINKRKYMRSDLVKYIKSQMVINNINQSQLGEACGHSQQTMSNRLNNLTLSVDDLITIFTLFDVPAEQLAVLLKEKH